MDIQIIYIIFINNKMDVENNIISSKNNITPSEDKKDNKPDLSHIKDMINKGGNIE